MQKCKGYVSSAEVAQKLSGMSCRFIKALAWVGLLCFSGYVSELGGLFVRESDGSMCSVNKLDELTYKKNKEHGT